MSLSDYSTDAAILKDIKNSLSILDKIFKNSQDSIIIIDKDGHIEQINPAFTEITGYTSAEILGKNIRLLKSDVHNQQYYAEMWEALIKLGFWKGEIFNKRKNGEVFASLLSIEANYENNQIKNFLAIFKDISEVKSQKNEIERLENFDYLTNLPNRKMLLSKLEKRMSEAAKDKSKVAVIFVDIDNFKNINDKYGHHFGDLLLLEFSRDLQSVIGAKDLVSRLGGDEFVIVISGIEDIRFLNSNIDKLLKEFSNKQYIIASNHVEISISMGVALPSDTTSADELMRNADQAMYQAKQQGKKRFIFFDEKQEQESIVYYQKIKEISESLDKGEFKLWYQPKVNAKTNVVVGFECLIRWIKSDGKIVPASEFIDSIYGNELDYKVGCFVLDYALNDLKKWNDEGKSFDLSINISPDHLLHDNFQYDLESLISKYNINPSTITLEILETSKISNFDLILEKMNKCIELGINFSLDDFGTGYSSLSYLRTIPTKEVKIDKSFVMPILKSKEDKLIISGIVGLAHALGRCVVAEGVETMEHVSILKDLDVDILQGYGISKPIPKEQIPSFLDKWSKVEN